MPDLTPLPAEAPWYIRWLVANWRTIWREFSTWFIAAAGLLAAMPEVAPDLWHQLGFGEAITHYASMACALAALISKYVRQPTLEKEPQ